MRARAALAVTGRPKVRAALAVTGRVKARAALAVGLALAAGPLLTGCGIPTTGVVEAGEPGVGVQPTVILYYVRAVDGTLVTFQRRTAAPVDSGNAVRLLLEGLDPVEQKVMGLASELPTSASATVSTDGDTVTVDLRAPAPRLSATAVDQVVCTVRAARLAADPDAGPGRVTVSVGGAPVAGSSGQDVCARAGSPWPAKLKTAAGVRPPPG
ncbi:hypothetical protein [Streptomyces sp. NBC_01477]|uniref:hypothetical protein n=1 Tax=Streptomyces sp. NBC_01477 TaxID=2976015 RepID=UPI002E362DC6|nr:hypothetical protein [Streptomyces sp. NBC_01477]